MTYSLYYDTDTLKTNLLWYYVVNNDTLKAYTSTDIKHAIKAIALHGWPVCTQPNAFTHHVCDFDTFEHLQQTMPELFL